MNFLYFLTWINIDIYIPTEFIFLQCWLVRMDMANKLAHLNIRYFRGSRSSWPLAYHLCVTVHCHVRVTPIPLLLKKYHPLFRKSGMKIMIYIVCQARVFTVHSVCQALMFVQCTVQGVNKPASWARVPKVSTIALNRYINSLIVHMVRCFHCTSCKYV